MVRTFIDHSQLDIPYAILCPIYFLRYPNQLATHVISVDVLSREVITRRRITTATTTEDKESIQQQSSPSSSSSHNLNFSDPSSSRQAAWQLRQNTANVAQSSFNNAFGFGSSSPPTEDYSQTGEDFQNVLKTTRLILKRGTLPKWAPAGIVRNAESWVLEESEIDLDFDPKGRKMKCWTRNLDHTTVMAVTENLTFSEKSIILSKMNIPATTSQLDSKHDIESSMGFGLVQSRIEKFGFQRVKTHVETSRKGLWMTYSQFLKDRKREGRLNNSIADLLINQLRHQGNIGDLEIDDLVGQNDLNSPSTNATSKRAKLLAALRPPFLDGDFVGPIARLRKRGEEVRLWWKSLRRGGTADKQHMRLKSVLEDEEAVIEDQKDGNEITKRFLNPMERLRKRFLSIRDGDQQQQQPQPQPRSHLDNHHPLPHPAFHPAPGGDPSQG